MLTPSTMPISPTPDASPRSRLPCLHATSWRCERDEGCCGAGAGAGAEAAGDDVQGAGGVGAPAPAEDEEGVGGDGKKGRRGC